MGFVCRPSQGSTTDLFFGETVGGKFKLHQRTDDVFLRFGKFLIIPKFWGLLVSISL